MFDLPTAPWLPQGLGWRASGGSRCSTATPPTPHQPATFQSIAGHGGRTCAGGWPDQLPAIFPPKPPRALLRIPSTEGRSVCLCWEHSKPEGPKGPLYLTSPPPPGSRRARAGGHPADLAALLLPLLLLGRAHRRHRQHRQGTYSNLNALDLKEFQFNPLRVNSCASMSTSGS